MVWSPACPGPSATHDGGSQAGNGPLFLPSPSLYRQVRRVPHLKYACRTCWAAIRVEPGRQIEAADVATPHAFAAAIASASARQIGRHGLALGYGLTPRAPAHAAAPAARARFNETLARMAPRVSSARGPSAVAAAEARTAEARAPKGSNKPAR